MLHVAGFAGSPSAAVVLVGTGLRVVMICALVYLPDIALCRHFLAVKQDGIVVLVKLGTVGSLGLLAVGEASGSVVGVLSVTRDADAQDDLFGAFGNVYITQSQTCRVLNTPPRYAVRPGAITVAAVVGERGVVDGLVTNGGAVSVLALKERERQLHGMRTFIGCVPAAVEDTKVGRSLHQGQELRDIQIEFLLPICAKRPAIGRDSAHELEPLIVLTVVNLNHGGHIPFGGSLIPATHAISQYCLPVWLGRFGELHAEDGILIQLPTVEMQPHSLCRNAELRFCQVPRAVLFPVPADAVDLLHAMKNGIRCLAGLLGLFFVGFFVFAAGHPCQAKRE